MKEDENPYYKAALDLHRQLEDIVHGVMVEVLADHKARLVHMGPIDSERDVESGEIKFHKDVRVEQYPYGDPIRGIPNGELYIVDYRTAMLMETALAAHESSTGGVKLYCRLCSHLGTSQCPNVTIWSPSSRCPSPEHCSCRTSYLNLPSQSREKIQSILLSDVTP